MRVKIKRTSPAVDVPSYQTAGAAGCDVHSQDECWIPTGETALINTGLFLEVPEGFECQIRPRSGLASRGLLVANSPGTIDSDYRGELRVLLLNTAAGWHKISRGDRIAQLVFAPVVRVEFDIVDELSETVRGHGGFGSTG